MLTLCLGIAIKIMVVGQKEVELSGGFLLFFATILLDMLLFIAILDVISKAVDCGL